MQHWPFPPFFRDAAGDDTLAGAEAIVFTTAQTKPATVHWSGLTFRNS